MTPYIGITGLTTREQVRMVFQGLVPPPGRRFMVGVLCGNRTLRGILTRWDTRRPLPAEIAGIFSADKHFLNLIHFRSSSTGDELLAQLILVTELGGPHMHGLQLNMTWPAPNVLEQYRSRFPQSQIVLQVGVQSFEEAAHDSEKLLNHLRQYRGLIEYTLLDKSEGFGKTLNTLDLAPYMKTLYASDLELGVVVAGGLSADTIRLLGPLTAHSSKLSIDAESRLRTADDELDIERCRAYIIQSLKFF